MGPIDDEAGIDEDSEVPSGIQYRTRSAPDSIEPFSPLWTSSELAEQYVRRCLEVARHLHGKPALWGKPTGDLGEEVRMLRDPLQRSVAHQDVNAFFRRPRTRLGLDQPHAGERAQFRSGRVEHVGRGIHSDQLCAWPPPESDKPSPAKRSSEGVW